MSSRERPMFCLLAAEETSPSVLYGLYDVLFSVGAFFDELTTGKAGAPVLDTRIVAARADPFRCFGGVLVEPYASIDAIERADVVVVCDMYLLPDASPRERYPREIAWLERMHAGGAVIASVCSGSLVLAEAGLLDGLEATGHWAYEEMFRTHYPAVRLRMGAALVADGEGGCIVTAGGTLSWQDLALHLIGRFCGARHAIETAKVHLMPIHSDGQLPYASMSRIEKREDAVVGECRRWVAEHFADSNPVAGMVERSGLNARTLARRFRAATGYSPIDYVHAVRLDEAKRALEADGSSVDDIAHHVGYEDPASFRRMFKRKVGMTPGAYRRKFATMAGVANR